MWRERVGRGVCVAEIDGWSSEDLCAVTRARAAS